MANVCFVRLYYQAAEEILETGVHYRNDLSSDPQAIPENHQDLANLVESRLSNLDDTVGNDFIAWAVGVEVPFTNGVGGPYRFIRASSLALSSGLEASMPDAATYNIQIKGTDIEGKPVTGGLRLSGVPRNKIDCNTLDSQAVTDLEAAIDLVFPPSVQLSGNVTFTRIILRDIPGAGVLNQVDAPTTIVTNRVGSRIDRVFNKPNTGRKKPENNGGPPDPT